MKIDEPKTPYAPRYDPAEDEDEMQLAEAEEKLIDAQDVVVDELDESAKAPKKPVAEDEIPELELGDPEESLAGGAHGAGNDRIVRGRSLSNESHRSDKHVVVGAGEANGEAAPGEDGMVTAEEAQEKHRQFEQQRKRHYEMRNIKELLACVNSFSDFVGSPYPLTPFLRRVFPPRCDLTDSFRHPENLDEMDEDEDEEEDTQSPPVPPPVPQIPEKFLNGTK